MMMYKASSARGVMLNLYIFAFRICNFLKQIWHIIKISHNQRKNPKHTVNGHQISS